MLLSLMLTALVAVAAPRHASASSGSATLAMSAPAVYALQDAQPPKDVNVDINLHGGGRWYSRPVWIAIGVLAAVVVLLMIVLIARGTGGGTTIVHE
jgi:hypothetical protein